MVNLSKKLSFLAKSVCLVGAFSAAGLAQAADTIELPASSPLAISLNQLLPVAGPQGYQEITKAAVFSESGLKVACTTTVLLMRSGVTRQTFEGCTVESGVTAQDDLPQWTLLDLLTKAATAQ